MGLKIRVDPFSYILGAAVLLLLPAKLWMAALFSASVHELFHLVALWLLDGQVTQLRLGICGAKIVTLPMSRGREVLCALAGPMGSFSLLALASHYPLAALFGCMQGAYNLLPIYPLDGGRIFRGIFSEAFCAAAETFFLVMLWGIGIWLITLYDLGLFPVLPALAVTLEPIRRKYPCKEPNFAVQ